MNKRDIDALITVGESVELKGKDGFAKKCTVNSTPAERLIRERMAELGFKQNEVVLGFIPDFSNERLKIIVEIDGSIHFDDDVKHKDELKNSVFQNHGWMVLRFSNYFVFNEYERTLKAIMDAISQREWSLKRRGVR